MTRFVQMCWLSAAAFLSLCVPVLAQERAAIDLTPSFGAGLTLIGAAYGIGRIGSAAVESMARQPEAAGDIRGGMILAAALIEGVTLFALVICLLAAL